MIRETLAIVCCLLLAVGQSSGAPSPQKGPQESLLAIGKGELVEVKLLTGQKLRGRLEEVRDDAFDVKIAGKQRLETRSLAFSEVRSIKAQRPSAAGKVALSMLAGAGAFMLVLFALAAAIAD